MRVSQLVDESGVPLATIKYYLRQGLLHPGTPTSARGADYDDTHLHRLRVVQALTGAGLPLQQVGVIVGLIEHPDSALFDALGAAVAALPPYPPRDELGEYPRARAVIESLGQIYDPRYAAVAQLEAALSAAESAGLPMSPERVARYGTAIRSMAEFDVGEMPRDSAPDALEYAVLGTALYEPVVLALRRLAHQDVAAHLLATGVAEQE